MKESELHTIAEDNQNQQDKSSQIVYFVEVKMMNPIIRVENVDNMETTTVEPARTHHLKRRSADDRWPPKRNDRANKTSRITTTTTTVETIKSQKLLSSEKPESKSDVYLKPIPNGLLAPKGEFDSSLESIATVEDMGKRAVQSSTFTGLPKSSINRNIDNDKNETVSITSQQPTQVKPKQEPKEQQEDSIEFVERSENIDGNKMTTTISTIAAQSGQSRIVLAMLKDGDNIQMKVQEMRPGIFEVGGNNAECIKYVEEHQRLMKNLSSQKRTPIDNWMEKYENIRQFKEPDMSTERKLVYICMAENLQSCWKALLNQLGRRTQLLHNAGSFFHQCDVKLEEALNKADNHVQDYRQEFLQGPQKSTSKFNQVCGELEVLNQAIAAEYNLAKKQQQQLIDLISIVGTGNLGDARVNYLISDAQNLINYINTYLDPYERRKLQLESVISTSLRETTTTITTNHTTLNNDYNNEGSGGGKYRTLDESIVTTAYNDNNSLKTNNSNNSNYSTKTLIREIRSLNDLHIFDDWLNVKIEQLNSSLLSSLGVGSSDSRSILNRHEQIALECRVIEEATLTFDGRNIHAIKSSDKDNNVNSNSKMYQLKATDKVLFEQQKVLAIKARDVISILDVRIILLRRTIDFYKRAKDATADIAKMMRRLQVDNSLQSVQFVSNELELKDVSSVVASGATIISELQQLQLAQQHGQRSSIVNLDLVTKGIRAIIDQLNQDLVHLKTVLNQRRLILLNEDAIKMANNFLSKCHQLHFWLNNHAKSFLLNNNKLSTDYNEVRAFCEQHENLRVAVQNKTLEVEALLRSLPTLTENFESKSKAWDEIQQATDDLRQDWINVTNCLDRRIEIARKFLTILGTVITLSKELDSLDRFNENQLSSSPDERTDEDIKSNVDQTYVQISNQIKNFNQDAQRINTELIYTPAPSASEYQQQKQPIVNDINKKHLVDHANGLLLQYTDRKQAIVSELDNKIRLRYLSKTNAPPAHQRPQQVDPPRFTRVLSDKLVEPFSTVELECETYDCNCQIDWFMNNFKKIPSSIKHVASSENNLHKLVINNFSSICCGTYVVRAVNSAGQAVSQCKLRMSGIKESQDEQQMVYGDVSDSSAATTTTGHQRDIRTSSTTTTTTSTKTQNIQAVAPSPAAVSTTSSFSQWRPSNNNGNNSNNEIQQSNSTSNKEISRIIRGVESSERDSSPTAMSNGRQQQSSSVRVSLLSGDSDTDTNTTTREMSKTPQFPVTQTTYSGTSKTNTNNSTSNNNTLRVNYTVESPHSSTQSTTLDSRSVSKSPFDGTPQPPVFVQGLSDSMPRCCSRAGLVCLVVGNPPPTIEWLHNNTPIATTKCVKTQTCPRANICKLTIETMNDCTQGQYVCRASNRLGQTSTKFTLAK